MRQHIFLAYLFIVLTLCSSSVCAAVCADPLSKPCPGDLCSVDLFSDNFTTLNNWTHTYTIGGDGWSLIAPDTLNGADLPYESVSYIYTNNPIALPSSASAYMQFDHSFNFEYSGSLYYDGGIISYSMDGGASWDLVDTLFSAGPYNGNIASDTNIFNGYSAFVGLSGLMTSRLDLSSLAGNNVMFSFWLGTDNMNGPGNWTGWNINNVSVYQCVPTVTVTTSPSGQMISADGGLYYTAPHEFYFSPGSSHTLSPAPPSGYTFISWTGDISSVNAPLSFTMGNNPMNIAANFDSTPLGGNTVRIVELITPPPPPVYYDTITHAYNIAINNDVIQAQALLYSETLTFNRPNLSLTLKGGCNATYSNNTGLTTVGSPFTIQSGTIIVDKIAIL